MRDTKLYKILENFDKIDSAADKLTPITENYDEIHNILNRLSDSGKQLIAQGDANIDELLTGEYTDVAGIDMRADIRILRKASRQLQQQGNLNRDQILNILHNSIDDALTDVTETQTTVQTMGNKIKVTTDGDTTEYDDAETAKAMMGDDEFTTESDNAEPSLAFNAGADAANAGKDLRDINVAFYPEADRNDFIAGYESVPTVAVTEGGLGGDMWDSAADELDLADYGDNDFSVRDEPPAEFGISDDEWMISDLDEEIEADFDSDLSSGYPGDNDDDAELATFDSEDESHRKRLQRGTPVVLSPDLFADKNSNRRGVFINRSPSGHYGTVIRDFDHKEVKVHLSDIVSADLVNNSVYEEYGINLESMLAEDKIKFSDLKVGQKFKKPNNSELVLTKTKTNKFKKNLTKPQGGAVHFSISPDAEVIAEDITMTQTTNLDHPENDTTTVTAVGQDAGDDLAALMTNAGLNSTSGYSAAVEPEVVDTGEPLEMQGMLDMMDAPEMTQEAYGDPTYNADLFPTPDPEDFEPSNAELDAIEADPEMFEAEGQATLANIDPALAADIIGGLDIAQVLSHNSHRASQKDLDILEREYSDVAAKYGLDEFLSSDAILDRLESAIFDLFGGNDAPVVEDAQPVYSLDSLLSNFDESEVLAWLGDDGNQAIDVALVAKYGTDKESAGDLFNWLYNRYGKIISDYAKENFGAHLGEERDQEYTNTPGELEAGVDVVTHGLSGGLNRRKNSYKLAAGGDNPMKRPVTENKSSKIVNEHESVDNFLNMYKVFKHKGEKK